MVKRIRPARHYQRADDPSLRLSRSAMRSVARELRHAFTNLSSLVDTAKVVDALRHSKNPSTTINFHHYREVLRGAFDRLGKLRHAGGGLGARKINGLFAAKRRKVRFRKAAKASKIEANYRRATVERQACADCWMFQAPQSCCAVEGVIDSRDTCDYFETIWNVAKDGGDHYNPDEPRDEHGRWTTGGSSGSESSQGGGMSYGQLADETYGKANPTAGEKQALSDYLAHEEFADTNQSLREGRMEVGDNAQSRELGSLIDKSRLPQDMTLYRGVSEFENNFGVNPGGEFLNELQGMKPGDIMVDRGFMSTSTSRGAASDYGQEGTGMRGAMLVIQAYAGNYGLAYPKSQWSEVILQHTTTFRLVSVSGNTYTFETVGDRFSKKRVVAFQADDLEWRRHAAANVAKSAGDDHYENEPRDEHGRWTTGGGGGDNQQSTGEGGIPGETEARNIPFGNFSQGTGRMALATLDNQATRMFSNNMATRGAPKFGSAKTVLPNGSRLQATATYRAGNSRGANRGRGSMVTWTQNGTSITRAAALGLLQSYIGKRFEKATGDQFSFDSFSPDIQQQIRDAQDALIQQLESDARDNIDTIIRDGTINGTSLDEIASNIKDMIGLTDTQSQAVLNYQRSLMELDSSALQRGLRNTDYDAILQDAIDAGSELSDSAVESMVSDYIDNYLDYRAATIAQTESTRAANAGLHDAYQQAIDRGALPEDSITRQWQLADNPCPICESIVDNNPDGVGVNESFDSDDGPIDDPPVHPNCECSVEYVTDLTMVPDDSESEYEYQTQNVSDL